MYTHGFTTGYPTDVDTIVSNREYGASMFIPTTKRLVVVTAPGPGSGKLAMEKLKELVGCEAHMTHVPTRGDEAGLRKLGVNLTTEPVMPSRNLLDG